jgi:hypothetical protein
MDEARLVEKLRLIEALFAGATTDGERVAADYARQRILERLRAVEVTDPPVEYQFSLGDMWSRRVFLALLRRYGLSPYRYRGQRHTTVMVRVSKRFVDETLWPEFQRIDETLRSYLSEITDRVVSQVIDNDLSEAAVVQQKQALPPRTVPPVAPPPPSPATEVRTTPPAPHGGGNGRPTNGAGSSQSRSKNKQKRKRRKGRRR